MKFVDLTLMVKKTNRIYRQIEVQSKRHMLMGHLGTHFDVYGDIQLPLDYMYTRGILFDVSWVRKPEVTLEDIQIDKVKKGDFVLFYTGSMQRHPYGSNLYFRNSTQFSWELIEALAKKQIKFVGIDAPDLRKGHEDHFASDTMFLKYGAFVVENLTNLDQLDLDSPFKVMTMWLEDPEATGIRCRVVAIQEFKQVADWGVLK